MADEEKITTSLEVDITDFKKGLSDANRYIRMANSEFENATAGMEKWSSSADGLRAKLTQLERTMEGQEAALEVLRHEYERVVDEQGENSKGAQELAIKINKQEAAVKKTAAQMERYGDSLQDMEADADDAGKEAKQLGKNLGDVADDAKSADKATDGLGKGLAGTLNKAATAAGKLTKSLAGIAGRAIVTGIKGVAAASAGLVTAFLATSETSKEWTANMAKLDAIAQETGQTTEAVRGKFQKFYGILGDETLATTTVSNLEAINLKEEKLAELTNAMTGIWAKYGDSIPLDGLAESVNETSQVGQVTGNLADALNWAGVNEEKFNEQLAACSSRSERLRLIIGTLDGKYGELGETYKEQYAATIKNNEATAALNDQLANVGQSALPVSTALKLMGASILKDIMPNIQQLGEAFTGVMEGSKGAADKMGAAVSGILQQLGGKIIAALPTILTVGTSVISSLVEGIVAAAPTLAAGVGQIVQYFVTAAPQFLSAGAGMIAQLLQGIASSLPSLMQQAGTLVQGVVSAIQTNLPAILAAGGDIIFQLLNGITTNLPAIAQGALNAISGFVQGLQTNLPIILEKGREMLGNLGQGIRENLPSLISQALDTVMNFATTIYDNAPTLIETGFALLGDLVSGILSALPTLISKVPEIISTFANTINDNFPTILRKGAELIWQIITGIISAIPTLIANIPQIITAIVDVWEAFNWLSLGKNAITALKNGITNMVGAVKTAGKNVLNAITNAIKSLPSKLLAMGKNAMSSLRNGISSMVSSIAAAGRNVLSSIIGAIASLPGKLLALGRSAITWLGAAISSGVATVTAAASNIFNSIVNYFQTLPAQLLSIGQNLVMGLWNGISNMTGWIIGKIQGFGESVLGGIKSFFGIASPSKVFRDEVGRWLPAGMAEGIAANTKAATSAMTTMAKKALGAANAELSGAAFNVPVTAGAGAAGTGGKAGGATYVFNQYNNSPKSLSRADIYRQTKSALRFATQT